MSIAIGSDTINRFYLKTNRIPQIYKGSDRVFLAVPAAPTIISLTYVDITISTWGSINCVIGWGDILQYRYRYAVTDSSSRPPSVDFISGSYAVSCGTAQTFVPGNSSGQWVHIEAEARNASGWGFTGYTRALV